MAQWVALAAHSQWVVGSNPIRVIGGVRKDILQLLLLGSKDKLVPRPKTHSEKSPIQGFSHGMETLIGHELCLFA